MVWRVQINTATHLKLIISSFMSVCDELVLLSLATISRLQEGTISIFPPKLNEMSDQSNIEALIDHDYSTFFQLESFPCSLEYSFPYGRYDKTLFDPCVGLNTFLDFPFTFWIWMSICWYPLHYSSNSMDRRAPLIVFLLLYSIKSLEWLLLYQRKTSEMTYHSPDLFFTIFNVPQSYTALRLVLCMHLYSLNDLN